MEDSAAKVSLISSVCLNSQKQCLSRRRYLEGNEGYDLAAFNFAMCLFPSSVPTPHPMLK
ncbi:hypothetical protein SCA6_015237 [Theobroma cacao]